ncbi:1-phosphatidylinositol-4 5-bisphosphate phosphodiesterase [Fusarium pseudoanthophilum]|uniref:Phosphoinositide phospholipase C n=1 Tax=Fusarium pseudoanthophilum TaxID=48495 RepID=A0A8H5PME0_9HYPO|nr:1-phosphatidylinositol-4 5-bisphosphate phosphodiesterase [Fusarium pseudoanthophilum]
MDLMSLTARDLSSRCLEAFQTCLTFPSADPGLSNQHVSQDERFEYRLADFNLWIDGIGALAPSKASLDSRLIERPIDLSLVKGNLVMLFQSLEDCLNLLEAGGSLEDALLDLDSALESLVTLSLAIRRTGRRSRLHKADRLFKPEEHAELKKHLEAIVLLRAGSGPCFQYAEFQTKIKSLTPLQNHLVTANLKRRNRFIQAQLHSLGLKKRSVGFELPAPEATQQITNPALSSPIVAGEIAAPISSDTAGPARKPLPAPMSVTSASIPESKLQYKEPVSERTESSPMTVITRITASARYPRPRISDNEQKVVQCPCCCQTLPASEAKNNSRWSHPQDVGEDLSAIISSFAQKRMGIESCPLCEVKGDADSSELIDHVLEHVHDFSLRSLPWPRPSKVDIGGEVGSFNPENGEAVAITQWLDAYEHETEDIDTSPKMSTCDYERLVIITEQIESQKQDKLGLDIGFADEHGDESAEAETDVSQLTQDTVESLGLVEESERDQDVVYCHKCSAECSAEWYRDEDGVMCPQCQSGAVEIVCSLPSFSSLQNANTHEKTEPETDPRDLPLNKTPKEPRPLTNSLVKALEPRKNAVGFASPIKASNREPASGFRRLTSRFFSRKKSDDVGPQDGQGATDNLVQFLGLKQKAVGNQKAWKVLSSIYHRRLNSPTKTQSMFDNFIRDVQNQESLPTLQPVSDHRSFLQVMVQFYLNPLEQLPPKDLKKPISNYFINTSHRTLLHSLSESNNAYNAIKEVLHFGHRSIDLDVWNGITYTEEVDLEENASHEAKPGQTTKTLNRLFGLNRVTQTLKPVAPEITVSYPPEPTVTDGYTLMTPCGFREACQVIRESAFVNSDLPMIINLEVHADSEQQEMMAKIMKEEWRDILVDKPLEGCDPRFRLPTLEDLRGRILIRLGTIMSPSGPNPGLFGNDLLLESPRRPGRVPIIQPLAELGIYLRREKFYGFTDMRTNSPSHLFSIPEGKVQELISTSPTNLFRHNKDYFFRVYPTSVRLNLDPLRFWRYGIQMVGIARHNVDEGMMLNEGMFADESGWVLKPSGYRSLNMDNPADPEEASRKGLELDIFAFKDQEFITSTGREIKNLASFMMVSLHINDEEKPRVPRQELNITENESGALGYNLNFLVTRAEATIIPKLCILR